MENLIAIQVGQLWEKIYPDFVNEVRIPGIAIDG
ncbi:Uncharacterised protein [Leclercia adecarboxylata]|uniref:Uncharacterized protein n=1 Tax=Leclercia adecarboxylata TaxID=83655 RepID=A0A4U9HXF5_9ENTR|nr:Uncharacterised protein [Leclercia adecarboxylata]STY91626.1 Uncharacterised protein [Leclercia adecarboxylata]VTP69432.1 Uncharacterised protein [Leclercia adecarboxylata]